MASSSPAHLQVSGIGLLTPLGRSIEDFDHALFGARSAVRAHHLAIDGQPPVDLAIARCDGFDDSSCRGPSRLPLDRGTAMALAAARDAALQAGIAPSDGRPAPIDPERLGLYWGSGMAGATSFDNATRALYGDGQRLRPTTVLTTMPNAAVAELALAFQARGAALGYACACASAAVAIGEAMRALRGGWIDIAIVGGHEALLTPGTLCAWHAMRVMAPPPPDDASRACRPFAADRTGFALGEGAAALVIETEAHARARGATSLGRLAGYGLSCDAGHITQPMPAGQQRAMQAALRDAGLDARDIGHLNAHGTATLAGDAAEARSVHALFGDRVPVGATKAIHGHAMGGGGAIELVATLRALSRGLLPPIAHLDQPDTSFGIDLVRGEARPAPGLRWAMSNAFAFGGTNAVLVAGTA